MANSAEEQSNHSDLIHFAKRSALDMGTEDINGFWELVWALRAELPDAEDELLLNVSQRALEELVRQRLVRVLWWDPSTDSDTDVTPDEAVALVMDRGNWKPPSGVSPVHPRFISTRSGDRVYYSNMSKT